MRFAPCVLLPSSLIYFVISNSSNWEFVQLALYICVIIVMFLVGSFIYGDRLLTEFADQPIVLLLFPFLMLTFLWSIRRGHQVKQHVITKPLPKPKQKPQKESGLINLERSTPPVKKKFKRKRMYAVKENLDPKVHGFKDKMIPILTPYKDLQNHPWFQEEDLYEEFSKHLLSPEQLARNDYPLENPEKPGYILTRMKTYNPSPTERICSRCGNTYHIENDIYSSDTNCLFHTDKRAKTHYSCCGKAVNHKGCKLGFSHVNPALPLDELVFKKTELKKQVKADQLRKVFGLDCEMVYTTLGFEVAKVTLVDVQGKPIYNTFVLPQHPVTDYNTMYSGISKKDLKDVNITFDDVQAFLLKTITKDTILVGHALHNDLKCLRIIHEKVVDTQVVFRKPEDMYRQKLKTLAKVYLNQTIQDSEDGHCSLEDARACMELMLKKIYDGLEVPPLKEQVEKLEEGGTQPIAPLTCPPTGLYYNPSLNTQPTGQYYAQLSEKEAFMESYRLTEARRHHYRKIAVEQDWFQKETMRQLQTRNGVTIKKATFVDPETFRVYDVKYFDDYYEYSYEPSLDVPTYPHLTPEAERKLRQYTLGQGYHFH